VDKITGKPYKQCHIFPQHGKTQEVQSSCPFWDWEMGCWVLVPNMKMDYVFIAAWWFLFLTENGWNSKHQFKLQKYWRRRW
jgi:hypothetical protein